MAEERSMMVRESRQRQSVYGIFPVEPESLYLHGDKSQLLELVLS